MRAPRQLEPTILSRADGVEAEILHEKAGTLQRLGSRLVAVLQTLAEHDRMGAPGCEARREELVREASEALWYYIVQREVCGLRDSEQVLRDLGVPREVHLRMGTRRGNPGRSPSLPGRGRC